MDGSILEQYRVSDLVEWYHAGKLTINSEYQRGNVWSDVAKVYLIDTILRGMPVPKLYIRTAVDLVKKQSVREVVDGQQRLRAIVQFADNKLRLTARAGEFAGLKYDDMPNDLQEKFLSYPVGIAQLINASQDDVLEVFSRLNSYTVTLTEPEQRHAQFQGEFKWAVREETKAAKGLWDKIPIVTLTQRIRMFDDSIMAEMFGVIAEGITDGGQPKITRMYERLDDAAYQGLDRVRAKVTDVWQFVLANLGDTVALLPIGRGPHFLMLFAAVAHARHGIPLGALDTLPVRTGDELSDIDKVISNLSILGSILEMDEPPTEPKYRAFWLASNKSTQRIASREIRFPVYFDALMPVELPSIR